MDASDLNRTPFSGDFPHLDIELLTMALDASRTGVTITDNRQADNPIIYCNEAFRNMSGYSEQEIIGRNCRFLQNKDRSQHVRLTIRNAIAEGVKFTAEIRNYRKNGDLFWNELHVCPIKDSLGQVTHFIGIQKDITKKKNAEQELRSQKKQMEKDMAERTSKLKDSESFLSSIIQTVRESLLVLDDNFNILIANDHFCKTFKVTPEETIGKQLYELGNHQWDIPRLKELLIDILPTSNPVEHFEVDHEFPHIGRKLMLLNAHRIELHSQYKNQILLTMDDITDKREIERRKDDFLAIASHEFRTPLTSIKGYLQTLERMIISGPPEKLSLILSKASLQVDRLNNMMSELLDLSRIQNGNLKFQKEWFNFDNMVAETVELFKATGNKDNITVSGTIDIEVFADETHIIQVINNLLSNAIKYGPPANEILITLSRVKNYIKVSVKDSGIGINADDQKKIFDRFFRVEDIQMKYAGMGIGLNICDEIIKNHGGSLWVESEMGNGSTFSFTLPIDNRP